MKREKLLPIFFLLAVLLTAFSSYSAWTFFEERFTSLPYYGNNHAAQSSKERAERGITSITAFSFDNQIGGKVNQEFVQHKIWVANYFFTHCPSICPRMSSNMQTLQKHFVNNDNVRFLSFSCDPERDNVNRLHQYAKRYNVNARQWQLATGNKTDLYRFARKQLQIVATDGDGGAGDFIHSQNFVLIDKNGFVRGYYDGTNEEHIAQLIKDIEKLKEQF